MARTVLQWIMNDERRTLEFDAVELEAPRIENAFTEYPIEMGSNLVDHVRQRPVTLRMGVVISNSPLGERPQHMDGMTRNDYQDIYIQQPLIKAPPTAQLPTSVAGVQLSRTVSARAQVRTWGDRTQRATRVQNIYLELRQAMLEARTFTIVTDIVGAFDGMVLRSMNGERTPRGSNSMRLELEFQQLLYGRLVSEDVSAQLPKKPVHPRSMPVVDEGKKETAPADPATQRSVAHTWFR